MTSLEYLCRMAAVGDSMLAQIQGILREARDDSYICPASYEALVHAARVVFFDPIGVDLKV